MEPHHGKFDPILDNPPSVHHSVDSQPHAPAGGTRETILDACLFRAVLAIGGISTVCWRLLRGHPRCRHCPADDLPATDCDAAGDGHAAPDDLAAASVPGQRDR